MPPRNAFISISVSPQQWNELEAELQSIPGGAQTAARLAINKAGKKAHTRIVRGLSQILNLKQSYIRSVVKFVPATAQTMVAKVRLSKQPIPLVDFPGVRQTRRGVVVKTRKGRPSELLRGTFIGRMKSGHVGIFERKGRLKPGLARRVRRGNLDTGKFYWSELPIDERFGPTPEGVFEHTPGVAEQEFALAQADLQKALASEVDFLLNRKKAATAEE